MYKYDVIILLDLRSSWVTRRAFGPPFGMLTIIMRVYFGFYNRHRVIINSTGMQVQGGYFNCSAQISVLKRKTLFNQQGSFVHREFHGTESLIGCPSFFILVLKMGRNS